MAMSKNMVNGSKLMTAAASSIEDENTEGGILYSTAGHTFDQSGFCLSPSVRTKAKAMGNTI